jgi:chemotaxis protein histidine kinase CheA
MEQDDDFDLKIKQDFISEALEMLGWVEDQFLVFEQNPNDSKVVDEIFRMAHTVKGSAMTCGFLRLGEFAHVMETLLVKIREGKHQPDSETVDVLLRANDTLRAYIEMLRSDFDAVLDTSMMTEDLMYFIGEDIKPTAVPTMAFGFFDDDEPVAAAAPAAETSAASPTPAREPSYTPITPLSGPNPDSAAPVTVQYERSTEPRERPKDEKDPLEELRILNLKAYLDLASDPSPEGIKSCLRTLEEALAQLTLLRQI